MAYGVFKVGVPALGVTLLGLGAVGGLTLSCGGASAGGGTAAATATNGARSRVIEHEECDPSGQTEKLDANNDGKPDITKVSKGGREVCRITDLNHDGKPDMFEYFDGSAQLRRREADYDDNGIVNSIETFENAKLVRRELDTTNQGRIDTWDFFDPATGLRLKRERDATGDGKIDQWWTYDGDRVTIVTDRNGDGQADADTAITLGANGQPVAGDGGAPSGPSPAASPSMPSPPSEPSALAQGNAGGTTLVDAGTADKSIRGTGAKR